MLKRVFILSDPQQRMNALRWLQEASQDVIVEFRKAKRTIPQNDRMWAMLSDIADAKPMGREHSPELWKALFMKAVGHEIRFIHGLDGEPFPMGFRSSKLNKEQMTALMDYIQWFADEHQVALNKKAVNG